MAEGIAGLAGLRCEVALVGTIADATPADAVRRLRERARVEVVLIADSRHADEGRAILRAGACGQLGRDAAPSMFVAALHAAASGLAAMDASLLDALLRSDEDPDGRADPVVLDGTASAEPDRTPPAQSDRASTAAVSAEPPAGAEPRRAARRVTDALSPRERELLRYLAEGYTNKEIARVMVLADDTVKKGVQSLIAKLGAADRTHAVVLALRSGLIQ